MLFTTKNFWYFQVIPKFMGDHIYSLSSKPLIKYAEQFSNAMGSREF